MVDNQILLLGADLDSPNQGVNALSLGTLSALSERFPNGYRVKILNMDGGAARRTTVVVGEQKVLVEKIKPGKKALMLSGLRAFVSRVLPRDRQETVIRKDSLLRLYQDAEFIIDLSEGDSFSETYGLRRLFKHFFYKLPAIILGKSLIIFPQTIGPFDTILGKMLARYALNHSQVIFTREAYSTIIARGLVREQQKVIESSDMAFLMEPETVKLSFPTRKSSFIGVNVSGLLYFGSNQQKSTWSTDTYRNFVRSLVTALVEEIGEDVVLIPHVRNPSIQTDDWIACQQLRQSCEASVKNRVYIVDTPLIAPQLKYIIGQSEYFIGSRMHSCIAALSAGVPITAVSYSHKFEGILRQLELEYLSCNPQSLSVDEMINKVLNCYERREEIRDKLDEMVPLAKKRALSSIDYL
jgi:colanic acid/amylovoran biosynthesis protein